jgi:TRAP-type transport system periplasmic protein
VYQIRNVVGAIGVIAVLGACTVQSGQDKAGGRGEPVVLQLADTSSGLEYTPAVAYFVERATSLSHGRLRIEVTHGWGDYAADVDQRVVRDVAAGKADLAWAPTRVFDTLGVSSFQALMAPMLVNSYALQKAVLASDIPGQMLHGVEPLGVTGLAVLGGGMRKPIAAKHPLLGPADWRGLKVEARRSTVQVNTLKALGAQPVELVRGGPSRSEAFAAGEIDASEIYLLAYMLNVAVPRAPYVTANVDLWPATMVVLANPKRWSQLTKEQQGWLTTAAAEAATRSTQLADQDAELVARACAAGARFVNASAADLDAMRQAVAPVYAELVRDALTKTFIERISALKASTTREPSLTLPADCPAAAAPDSTSGTTSALDGVYRWTLTVDDARTHGTANDQQHLGDWYPTTFTMTLRAGRWEGRQTASPDVGTGAFGVSGSRITFDDPAHGTVLNFTFAVGTNGDLTLTPIPPMDPGDQFVMSLHSWTRIGRP